MGWNNQEGTGVNRNERQRLIQGGRSQTSAGSRFVIYRCRDRLRCCNVSVRVRPTSLSEAAAALGLPCMRKPSLPTLPCKAVL